MQNQSKTANVSFFLCLFAKLNSVLGNLITGEIGRHDEDSVLALNSLSLSVGQTSLVKKLNEFNLTFKKEYVTWSKTVSTSGWAFSTSSKRTTASLHARRALVSCPPSSCPMYPANQHSITIKASPGGEPISLATSCFD